MAGQQKKDRGNQTPKVEKDWKEESDSPIELAKMNPFVKKCMKICFVFTLLTFPVTSAYMFWDVWSWDDDIFDAFYTIAYIAPPILGLCFLKIQRTSKVREDE